MKKLFSVSIVLLFLYSCGGGGDTLEAKKKQLTTYRSELEGLKTKIADLEKEIATADPNAAKAATAEKVVSVADATAQSFSHYIELQGMIESENTVMVNATMGGLVKKLYVKDGQSVAAGQLLCETDMGALEQSMKQLEVNIAMAKTALERQESLWNQKIGSEMQYLQAKTAYESILQQLESLKEQKKLGAVRAPIAGVVDEVMIKQGQTIGPGSPVCNIVNNGVLHAKARVPDVYVSNIHKGNATLVIQPDSKDTIRTSVTFIGESVNLMTHTFNVECNINGSGLKPNQYVKLAINDQTVANAIVLPENVVQQDGDKKYVFVVVSENSVSKIAKRYVSTGLSYNGKIQITSGIQKGDKYVTLGFQTVADGQAVVIR